MSLHKDLSTIEQLNTGAFKYAAVGLAYLDLNGRFILSNSALQSLLDYSETRFKTLLLNEILHPSETDEINITVQELISGKVKKS